MFSAFFRSLKQEFAGYNSKKLLADMMAGLTVCAADVFALESTGQVRRCATKL